MTALSVVQGVCTKIGLTVPNSVVAETDRESVELTELMQEMAEEIMRAHEWELLKRVSTYTGDGSTEAFDLPSDYERMPTKADLWSSSLETALSHISDSNKWLELDIQSFDFVVNAWIKIGGQINIKPALASGVTAKHYYQSNLVWRNEADDANIAEVAADGDTFRLSERLLKLGMIWRWKANKGRSYAEDMANYENLKEKLINQDKGARMISIGRVRMPFDARIAYPQSITSP